MKKLLKVLLSLIVVAVLCAVGAVIYVTQGLPNIAVRQDLRVEATPERLARGEYLANSVCVCMDCHSTRDWAVFSGPLKAGTLGVGGESFDQAKHFPGAFVAPNITPHHLKDWSDGELYRAITCGVSKDGRPLFPIMPYPYYGKMATEDIYSLMTYVRSLASVSSSPALSKADPPMNVILHLMPMPDQPMALPAKSDSVAYGGYLANAAGCAECHTHKVKGKAVGPAYAGGFEFPMPGGTVRSPNITPHPTTGIGAWSKQMFVDHFKAFAKETFKPMPVDMAGGQMQTVMPWTMYANMTPEDLGAIYDYLKSVAPAENQVERWTTASK